MPEIANSRGPTSVGLDSRTFKAVDHCLTMRGSRVEMVNTAKHQHVDQKSKIMEIVLRKLGSSTVLVIPRSILKELGLVAGQSMTLHSCADQLNDLLAFTGRGE